MYKTLIEQDYEIIWNYEIKKILLSCFDDKIYIQNNYQLLVTKLNYKKKQFNNLIKIQKRLNNYLTMLFK